MADVGLRDIGPLGPRGTEPTVAPPTVTPPPTLPHSAGLDLPPVIVTPPPASPNRPIFAGDRAAGEDALGRDPSLALLAEAVAHRGTSLPLTIGLFGAPGSGKSFSLSRLVTRLREIASAATQAPPGPYLTALHVQEIDASALDGDPALALAAQIHSGLRRPYPDLARETGHAVQDPQTLVRETNDKLDQARKRLDSEQRLLEESGSRLARLNETVLYESAGSQIDSYARANRTRIENRFNAFGVKGDPIRNFKDFVSLAAESGGLIGLVPRTLFEFKGQLKLIIWAVVLVLLGVGLEIAFQMQDSWLAALRSLPAALTPAVNWLADHTDLLAHLKRGANFLAVFLVLCNLLRATLFLRPIISGIRLLRSDLEMRRRDLGSLYAHQTKRADVLAAEVEKLSRAAAEAERRAGTAGVHGGLLDVQPFETNKATLAQGFFASLSHALRDNRPKGSAPNRLVLVVDHLESVAPERARAILNAVHRAATTSGLVALIGVDPEHLQATRSDLERWVQIPFSLDMEPEQVDFEPLVAQLAGRAPAKAATPPIDPARSRLDAGLNDRETLLLTALAPLAGNSPRAVKRLVNLYTLARPGTEAPGGLLALFLAVELGGTWAERQAAMALGHDAPFDQEQTPRWLRAMEAVEAFEGRSTPAQAATAFAWAHSFSIPA